MLISQLPDKIRKKALDLQASETDSAFSKNTDDLHFAFDWRREGANDREKATRHIFWHYCTEAQNPNQMQKAYQNIYF